MRALVCAVLLVPSLAVAEPSVEWKKEAAFTLGWVGAGLGVLGLALLDADAEHRVLTLGGETLVEHGHDRTASTACFGAGAALVLTALGLEWSASREAKRLEIGARDGGLAISLAF